MPSEESERPSSAGRKWPGAAPLASRNFAVPSAVARTARAYTTRARLDLALDGHRDGDAGGGEQSGGAQRAADAQAAGGEAGLERLGAALADGHQQHLREMQGLAARRLDLSAAGEPV